MNNRPVSADDVRAAHETLRNVVRETPLEYSPRLSGLLDVPVYLKREDLQVCRSFKSRGAYIRMAALSQEQRDLGVVCASAGNHAQGVANACSALGIEGTIYLPTSTPRQKRERIASIGAGFVTLEYVDGTFDDTQKVALEDAQTTHRAYIHPYDDPLVIAGQGTVATDILAQLPDVANVVIPVGGGGLISGMAVWLKSMKPDVRIIGVEPVGAACAALARKNGHPTTLDSVEKFADGVAVGRVGDVTYGIIEDLVDDLIAVPEGAISTEMLDLYHLEGIITEPAGALASATLVSLASGRIEDLHLSGPTVAVISGGNNDLSRYAEIMERSMTYKGIRHFFLVTFPQQPGALRHFLDSVLGEADDIVHFEYTKKNNRDTGPALVGIDVGDPEDFPELLKRMEESPLHIERVRPDSELLRFLI